MPDHAVARLHPLRPWAKVLLHDHLMGLRPAKESTARETGYRGLPTEHPEALGAWFRSGADRKSLELYLEGFSHTVGVMQTPDATARAWPPSAPDLAATTHRLRRGALRAELSTSGRPCRWTT
ncbi:MAG: hypothetical protein U0869_02105 [Chloroflexota bacterium]